MNIVHITIITGLLLGVIITAFGFTIAYYYVKWRNEIFETWGKSGSK